MAYLKSVHSVAILCCRAWFFSIWWWLALHQDGDICTFFAGFASSIFKCSTLSSFYPSFVKSDHQAKLSNKQAACVGKECGVLTRKIGTRIPRHLLLVVLQGCAHRVARDSEVRRPASATQACCDGKHFTFARRNSLSLIPWTTLLYCMTRQSGFMRGMVNQATFIKYLLNCGHHTARKSCQLSLYSGFVNVF